MRNIIPLLAVALGGCSAGQSEVWLLTIPVMDNTECSTTIEENFTEADPPEEDEPTTDWIFGNESSASDQLVYISIVDGKKGTAFLTIGDLIYPGTRSGDGYAFEWTGSEDSTDSEQYVPNPYSFTETIVSSSVTKITLNKNKDTGGLKGNLVVEDVDEATYNETDQWQYEEAGGELPVTGFINNWTQYLLVGTGWSNEWETPECDDPECMLAVKTDCAGTVDITAEWVGYGDEGVYAALENAEQPAGT